MVSSLERNIWQGVVWHIFDFNMQRKDGQCEAGVRSVPYHFLGFDEL